MTLVVLAAGMGSRYGGLKQIDPITENGEFIIDFSVYDAIRAGYDQVVFVIKEENYQAFRSTVGARIEPYIRVDYAFQKMELPFSGVLPPERVKPLGTAHAVLACEGLVEGNFAVINSDDYYGVSAFRLAKEYLEQQPASDRTDHYCMVGYRLGNTLTEYGTVSRGICQVDEAGYLRSIVERTKIRREGENAAYLSTENTWVGLSGDSVASMNFFGFRSDIFADIRTGMQRFWEAPTRDRQKDEYFLPLIVDELIRSGKCDLRVLTSEDRWFGVTYHEDKPFVVNSIRKLISAGVYPENLWRK